MDESGKYGIGQTGSGGSRGMAALEGLVAAVEVRQLHSIPQIYYSHPIMPP